MKMRFFLLGGEVIVLAFLGFVIHSLRNDPDLLLQIYRPIITLLAGLVAGWGLSRGW